MTDTRLRIEGDRFSAEMICDLDALLLGLSSGHDPQSVEQRLASLSSQDWQERVASLQEMFRRRVRVRFDGQPAPFEVDFPQPGAQGPGGKPPVVGGETSTSRPAPISGRSLGTVARLTGRVPEGAQEVTFFASRSFRAIRLTLELDLDSASALGAQGAVLPESLLQPGEESSPYPVVGVQPEVNTSAGGFGARAGAALRVAVDYLVLGFEHIVPLGYDHILFVLALFLLGTELGALLWQVTAFTVAHTLTLALSVLGWISIPAAWVEPLIAASIVLVAVENLWTQELRPRRVVVVFLFGLLHGLGFGGVLEALGLPTGRLILGLLSFNVGVELGQLAVIAVAALLLGTFRSRTWYRPRVTQPLSAMIALAGLVLLVQRLVG